MKIKTPVFAVAVAVLISAAPSMAATSSTTSSPGTRTSCIERTHGNESACHVGKGNAAKLPFEPATARSTTPNDCIKLNHGDWNACNVGNSGAGNRPYRPPVGPDVMPELSPWFGTIAR